ncbi:hypothetical protein QUA81_08930 [Microcoleus sp. F6_B4]
MVHPSVGCDKAFMGAENATLPLIPSTSVLWRRSQQQVFLKVKREQTGSPGGLPDATKGFTAVFDRSLPPVLP